MKTVKTATGKTIPAVIAAIYVRESFKATLQFMDKDRQDSEMKKFNKTLWIGLGN